MIRDRPATGPPGGRPLRVLHVASELSPWSQTGGLGEVVGALPDAVAHLGDDLHVAVVTPLHRGVPERILAAGLALGEPRHHALVIGATHVEVQLRPLHRVGHATIWFVDAPALYDREGVYGPRGGGDHPDNPLRFAVLCRVAVDLGAELCGGEIDVLHAHDWQTGLAPVYLRLGPPCATASVFTVHNVAFRGLVPMAMVDALGLPWSIFDHHHMEFYGELSLLKGGLGHADAATTVSPTYAREILEPACGEGLDGFLRWDVARLLGIRNGIDVDSWDPARDPALAARFSADDLRGREACRRALAAEHGLTLGDDTTLAIVVSRLAGQKGVDLIAELVPELHALDLRLIVLGSGEPELEERWRWLAGVFRDHLAVTIGFDPALSRRMYAGGDLLLMPSRFEPCGIGQMYAMRYGAVPVVHAVGGLRDTVVDPGDAGLMAGAGTGIAFEGGDAAALRGAVARAVRLRRGDRAGWQRLQVAAMRRDWSWGPSAQEYVQLYRAVARRAPRDGRPLTVRPGGARLLAGVALLALAGAGWRLAPTMRAMLMRAGAPVAQRALAGADTADRAPAQRPPADAAPAGGPVRVLVLDGLARADAALPALAAALPSALPLTVDVGFPTKSLPVQHVLWTGLTAQQSGVAADNRRLAVPVGVPAQIAGAVAIVESHRAIAGSFGFARLAPDAEADRVDPRATVAAVRAWRDQGFAAASLDAVRSDAPLVLIHVLRIDASAHAVGRAGARYRDAVAWSDQLAATLVAARPDARWLILADHGHLLDGGHGDAEDAVRRVRAWIAPAPVDLTAGAGPASSRPMIPEVHLVDVARWLAEVVGAPRDPRAVGRPLATAIAHPDRDATLPAPGAWRWLVALGVLAAAVAAAVACLRRRVWLAAWPLASIALVGVIAGVPSLSHRPAGWLLLAAGAGPAGLAWMSACRTSASGVRTFGGWAAPAVAVVVGHALLAGVPTALLGGAPPRVPGWTGALGASSVGLAGAILALGALLVVSGVRTMASARRT